MLRSGVARHAAGCSSGPPFCEVKVAFVFRDQLLVLLYPLLHLCLRGIGAYIHLTAAVLARASAWKLGSGCPAAAAVARAFALLHRCSGSSSSSSSSSSGCSGCSGSSGSSSSTGSSSNGSDSSGSSSSSGSSGSVVSRVFGAFGGCTDQRAEGAALCPKLFGASRMQLLHYTPGGVAWDHVVGLLHLELFNRLALG